MTIASQAFGPHSISQTPPSHALVQLAGHCPTGGKSTPQIASPVSVSSPLAESVLASLAPSDVNDVVTSWLVEASCELPSVVVGADAAPALLLELSSSPIPTLVEVG